MRRLGSLMAIVALVATLLAVVRACQTLPIWEFVGFLTFGLHAEAQRLVAIAMIAGIALLIWSAIAFRRPDRSLDQPPPKMDGPQK